MKNVEVIMDLLICFQHSQWWSKTA